VKGVQGGSRDERSEAAADPLAHEAVRRRRDASEEMNEIRGSFDARGRRFAVVASDFNQVVVGKLVEGAVACFRTHGISDDDLVVAWVPGAFELPLVAKELAQSDRYDAVVCLGAVIRGETAHFDLVAEQAASGIQHVALETGVPVVFGVLATDNMEQALDRAGGKHGNKGWDAAMAAMQMSSLLNEISGRMKEP
jgi:6,7-dimethyl-8-ribityllumazine synthase